MTKADLALKKLQFGALATGFATWKDMTTVAKHMRLLDDTAGVNRLKDLKDPIQKIEYILQKWQMKDIVSALSIWKNQYRQYYLEQVVFSEQIFARQEICDQRYRVIMRQWKSASQAKAVANWRQKVLEDRAARAASGGVAGKNKHNYEVLCKRILRLDSSIFECHVMIYLSTQNTKIACVGDTWLFAGVFTAFVVSS